MPVVRRNNTGPLRPTESPTSTGILSTQTGVLKGKLSYMSPEQMRNGPVDCRADLFSVGIVLWETLTHKRLFKPDDAAAACAAVRLVIRISPTP